MSKKNTTLQTIRISTIKHQLKALASQMEAIKKLDCEHHEGLDLGADPEVKNILHYSRRLAGRAETIVKKANAHDSAAVEVLLNEMREDVTYLSEHADGFLGRAKARADEHLQEMVHVEGKDVGAVEQVVKAGNSSYVQAGLSCFKAETNQYRTFEIQVLALVYLALEIAYFAADEVGVKPLQMPASK